jgi:hypothetical protein
MLGDDLAVLANDDALGIGMHLDWPADGARRHAVLVAVETETVRLAV